MAKVIIFKGDNGGVSIIHPSPSSALTVEQIANKDVPSGKQYKIIFTSEITEDLTFFDAWEISDQMLIKTNIVKAKEIAHTARRLDRANKMKPLDIEVTIPGMYEEAEKKRKVIRDENSALRVEIDEAQTTDELKALLSKLA